MFKALIVLGLAGFVLAGTPFDKCGNDPAPTNLEVKGCKAPPCPIYRGKPAIMDIDFVAGADAQDVTMKVYATVFGLTTEYVLPDDVKNTCSHLTKGSCPLKKGQDVSHHFEFPVAEYYPPIQVNLKFVEENEKKEVVSCYSLDIKVR